MVYYLALKAGLSNEEAVKIATASQYTDDSELTWSTSGRWAYEWWELYRSGKKYFYSEKAKIFTRKAQFHHFVTSAFEEVNPYPSNKYLQALKQKIIEKQNPILLGIFLHAVADSYSHQGFTWEWNTYVNKEGFPFLPPVGHARQLHSPDQPYNNVEKACDMAISVEKIITEYSNRFVSIIPLKEISYIFKKIGSLEQRSEYWKILIKEEFPYIKIINYNKNNILENEWIEMVGYYQSELRSIFYK